MKICYRCKIEKPLYEFSKNNSKKDKLNLECRACHKVNRKKHYEANKCKLIKQIKDRAKEIVNWVASLKRGIPCTDCKKIYIPFAMDYDHKEDKKFNISSAARAGFSKENILKEIEKCDLVCATCHRIRTYNRRAGLAHVGRAPGFQPGGEGIVTLNPHHG